MTFTNKKINITILALTSAVLFTACSSKKPVTTEQINKIYKKSNNSKIRNSKAMHRATLRPYNVFGVNYYPKIESVGTKLRGIASWYGPNFHAKKTSNGETYDMYGLTAAHKTLPMNTIVRVDNQDNGKSVVVRINDRGPFVRGRIIDLSNKAAHQVEMVSKGTANVVVTVLGFNGEIENDKAPIAQLPKTYKKQYNNSVNMGSYAVQVGAFSQRSGAITTKSNYEQITDKKVILKTAVVNNNVFYKVLIIGFTSDNEALDFKTNNSLDTAIIVKQ